MFNIRNLNKLIILFMPLMLVACEFPEPTRTLISEDVESKDVKLIERYEQELSKNNIPYNVEETADGGKKITWEAVHSEKAKKLERSILGLSPPNTDSSCFFDEKSKTRLTDLLTKNDIPYGSYDTFNDTICVHWGKNYSDKVAKIYPIWKEIQELEKKRKLNTEKKESNKEN